MLLAPLTFSCGRLGIFYWAKAFLIEMDYLREGGMKILLHCDGYSCHVRPNVFQLFKDNGLDVLSFRVHTSHVLQPLGMWIFSSFKHFIRYKLSQLVCSVKCADAYHIAGVITAALILPITSRNTQSGSLETGLWDPRVNRQNEKALKDLPFYDRNCGKLPTLQDVIRSFMVDSKLFCLICTSTKPSQS